MNLAAKLLVVSLGLAAVGLARSSSAEGPGAAGMVRINGVATPVFFNDGDTFRPLAGPLRQRPSRLAGFNTLESYGPVHQWGGWTFRELYVNAKQATLNGRRGTWSCDVDPKDRDGYGRLLAICYDLTEDQIRKGLAHAMSIDGPSPRRLIEVQRKAIVQRSGMWAKGVPPLVLTSLHSADERLDNKNNYNRLVSPLDGASTKWKHQDLYGECQKVCHPAKVVERQSALEVIAALRTSEATRELVRGYEDPYLMAMLNEYASIGRVAQIFAGDGHQAVKTVLDALRSEGAFVTKSVDGSCMIYATFERRYRVPPKPECLKW